MNLVDIAASRTDKADLLILANIETIRDQMQPATATAVAALIGGAPRREIENRMRKMVLFGALEVQKEASPIYRVTELGCELLRRELIGWSPSKREDRRREQELLQRLANPRKK